MSKLVLFEVVEYQWNETQNVLRPEWVAIFPSLKCIKIKTNGNQFRFRLDSLKNAMQRMNPLVEVVVRDDSEWIEDELSDHLDLFEEIERDIMYDGEEQELRIKATKRSAEIEDWMKARGLSQGRARTVSPRKTVQNLSQFGLGNHYSATGGAFY